MIRGGIFCFCLAQIDADFFVDFSPQEPSPHLASIDAKRLSFIAGELNSDNKLDLKSEPEPKSAALYKLFVFAFTDAIPAKTVPANNIFLEFYIFFPLYNHF